MNAADLLRTACLPTEDGCRKCQWMPPVASHIESYFLMASQNTNARNALRKSLADSEIAYQDWGAVLALPGFDTHLTGSLVALMSGLPERTRQDVKGTFYRGDAESGERLMKAFLNAESLSILIDREQHEWVREALADEWLFSVFHPIVTAKTGDVFGHEALIRARHPQTGVKYGAGQVINASSALNLDHILDQQARKTAIRQAAALPQMEGRIFINFMPNTIYDPEICLRTTMEAAHENGISLSRLVFEVVETEHIPDMKRLKTILDYYRSRGVGTAVDDMGAGYSSLRYLTMLQPDFVKLDRDLVVHAEFEADAQIKMEMIISHAKDLGIQVIAEGIETPGQLKLCQDLGADYLQGYLFGLPANPPVVSRAAFEMPAGS